jgi:hypothetical protein
MKQETTRRPLIRKVITSKNTENDMTELDENENITIANNNMKKVTSTSVEGDNVFPSFESISKNKFKTSFTQTEVTTHTNNTSTCTTTDAIEAEIRVHSVTVGFDLI